jgi:hypothetical protein
VLALAVFVSTGIAFEGISTAGWREILIVSLERSIAPLSERRSDCLTAVATGSCHPESYIGSDIMWLAALSLNAGRLSYNTVTA